MEVFLVKVIILLFFSFLFSGTEPAFFSLTPWKILKLNEEQDLSSKLIVKLYNYKNLILATILIGNETVNILTSSLFAKLKYSLFPQPNPIISTAFVLSATIILLLGGEITPKMIALKKPVSFLKKSVFVVYPLSTLLIPLKRFFKNNGEEQILFLNVIHIARKEKAIDDTEAFFYENIFKAASTPCLFAATPINKINDKSLLKGHPLPEIIPLSRAIEIMQKEKTNILTIDESGSISGVITRKNLINYFTYTGIKNYLYEENTINGEMPVSLFEYHFDTRLNQNRFKTINGYVFNLFGRLPEEGEEISDNKFRFKVLEIKNNFIHKLKVEKLHD
ncbi:conserved hypothetical protein [Thermotomaculum hydrothermale]|uniref:CNNM transmembrane domain-containing protein n=1 Tax=Thermotomaculum hydrothermale TaxID=981385 RepID=A0A7R6SY27_9BACT|nr:CNNM domain-containing protein [Thermotomaculum hydrothermale]BBB32131.1 conserved hypothetical protein [Thermotomaculum hydrothermale]